MLLGGRAAARRLAVPKPSARAALSAAQQLGVALTPPSHLHEDRAAALLQSTQAALLSGRWVAILGFEARAALR